MSVAQNLSTVKSIIAEAARKAGRAAGDVTLVAVGKMQPQEKIMEALEAGQRVFGENRVQEARGRWEPLRARYPDIKLHLIGPLQTNKVKEAVALFDVIQTLDREKLARALADEMKKQDKFLPCFLQVNTGGEAQKSGLAPEDTKAFLQFCRNACGLRVEGLMCIPPVDEPPEKHFAMLRGLARDYGLAGLSMGMSGDYGQAVALGATHVRVGTALFGDRSSLREGL